MRYLRGVDDAGTPYPLNDPMAVPLQNLALTHAADAQASVQALGALVPIWGDLLVADQPWLASVTRALRRINTRGMLNALTELNAELGAGLAP